jgi:oxygen-independent coproporphyrinogen-3 oxidase
MDDRLRASVIEALMCQGTVDLEEATLRYGAASDWYAEIAPELERLEEDGLIKWRNARVTVEADALHLVRVVAAVFDAYLAKQTARHSVAV